MKKSTVAIISVICTIAICVGGFLINDHSTKRNGNTRESRELVLREDAEADFVIEEFKTDDLIFCAYELSNGRIGVAKFKAEDDKYRLSGAKYADKDVPNVQLEIVDKKFCYIVFLNNSNLDYAEITYNVTTYSGKREDVVFKYEVDDKLIICSESPQGGEPIGMVFYEKNGEKHEFTPNPDGTRESYVKK